MKLVAFLLLLIGAVHYGTDHLAELFTDASRARKSLFYAAQGVKGFALFGVIAWISLQLARARGMKAFTVIPLLSVCAWGAMEDFEVAACRLARGIEAVPTPGPWRGVCDELTGLPLYMIGLFVGLFVACIVEYGSKTNDRRT